MVILPLVYFGSVEYWSALVNGGDDVVIDLGEHYVKRSDRNRTEIMTAGGVMQLSVQLRHANKPRQPMRKMEIDYSKRWQHQHLVAIESAYRSSPYYEYYGELFKPLFEREWHHLADLNLAILELICKILRVPMPRISEEYVVASEGDIDMRKKRPETEFIAKPYIQVFSDRMPFEPNLSIFDLVMCEGRGALTYLKR
jgi:hypothetical protein